MGGLGVNGAEEVRPFPAIDPEPPPRSRRSRAARAGMYTAAAAVLVAAGLLVANLGGPAGGHRPTLPPYARAGTVLALTPSGTVVETTAAGTPARPLASLGNFSSYGVAGMSPDRRYLVFPSGEIVDLARSRPRVVPTALHLGRSQIIVEPDPMAGHDRAVVVMGEGRYGAITASSTVSAVDPFSGASTSLGTGYSAAADPEQLGAFVVTAAPPAPISGTLRPGQAASQVEWRDAGRPAVVLATATQLDQDLGLDPHTPVALTPLPDPRGDTVAIEVTNLLTSGPATDAVVFVDRAGHMVATVDPALGPVAGTDLAWSPDGTRVAWESLGPGGPATTVYTLSGGTLTRPLPATDRPSECLWNPPGTAVLCVTGTARPESSQKWTTGGASGLAATTVRAPGFPLAWYRTAPQ